MRGPGRVPQLNPLFRRSRRLKSFAEAGKVSRTLRRQFIDSPLLRSTAIARSLLLRQSTVPYLRPFPSLPSSLPRLLSLFSFRRTSRWQDKTFQLFPTSPSIEENCVEDSKSLPRILPTPLPVAVFFFLFIAKKRLSPFALSPSLSAISRFIFPLPSPFYDLYVGREWLWRRRRGPPLPASWLLGPPFAQRGRRNLLLGRGRSSSVRPLRDPFRCPLSHDRACSISPTHPHRSEVEL